VGATALISGSFFSPAAAQPSSRSAQTAAAFDRRPASFVQPRLSSPLRRIVQTAGARGVGDRRIDQQRRRFHARLAEEPSPRRSLADPAGRNFFSLGRRTISIELPTIAVGLAGHRWRYQSVAKRAKLRCADLEVRHQQIAEQFRGVIGLNGDPRGRGWWRDRSARARGIVTPASA